MNTQDSTVEKYVEEFDVTFGHEWTPETYPHPLGVQNWLRTTLKQAQDDVRRELVDENTSDGYHTHTTLQGIIDTLEEDRRSFVTQPAEYKGSDANVWREGYNAALSNAQEVIRKLLDKSE